MSATAIDILPMSDTPKPYSYGCLFEGFHSMISKDKFQIFLQILFNAAKRL